MVILDIEFKQIKVIPADKDNENHRKGVWIVKNQNFGHDLMTTEPIHYDHHLFWWETAFDKEYIYIILSELDIIGYIRLTKYETDTKEKFEISIALAKEFQKSGIGSYAYKLFENEMKKIDIPLIIALTHIKNEEGQKFFEKNKFEKTYIKKDYIRYVKKP